MKKLLLFTAFLSCFALGHAQSKTVAVETAGTLSTLISADEAATLTDLTVTGSINKADLDTLNGMPALANIDLSGANIVASTEGDVTYAENTIPDGTFTSNKSLKNVVLPNSLVTIGDEAFYMTELETVDLSNCSELKEILDYAFGSIQETLTTVSFNGCSKLESIGDYAFTNDKVIASIDFTGCTSLTTLGNRAFLNLNSALETIDLSDCSAMEKIGDNCFRGCKVATSIILPEGAKVIGENAFYQCNAVETITIPASVDSIAPYAFYQPKALKTVVCLGTDTKAAERAFTSVLSSKPAEENYNDLGYTLVVPKGCADTYRAGIEWAKFAVINESTSAIESVESNSTTAVYATSDAIVVEGARCRHTGNRHRPQWRSGEECRGRRFGSLADPRHEGYLPGKSGQRGIQSHSLNTSFLFHTEPPAGRLANGGFFLSATNTIHT